jgi:hypothetical protein
MAASTNQLTSENDLTTHANYIPSLWPGMVVEFREANLVMANLVNRRDEEVVNAGDTFYYPITSKGTAVDYVAGYRLSDNLQVDTDSVITLSINQFKMHPFHIPWNVQDQVKYDTMALNMRQAGEAIARAIDSTVHAVALAGFTQTKINASATGLIGDLTRAHITGAFTALNTSDVPYTDRAWVFHPTAFNEILNMTSDYFTSHDFVDNSPMVSGNIGTMLGAPVYISTNVGTSTAGSPAETSYANLYFHRDAIALAMQRQPEMEQQYDIDTQGIFGNVRTGYGCVLLRGDHGVVINTVND